VIGLIENSTAWLAIIMDTEVEFLDVIGIKALRVFLLAIHRHLY
jgi:hypothetical protein